MKKERMEMFSDGVLAIVITIMVLELHAPQGASFRDLGAELPTFLVYATSFAYLGMCWVNHYLLLQTLEQVSVRILWANLLWLFLTSLIPFGTAWASETGFARQPTALYCLILTLGALSYHLLIHSVDRMKGKDVGYLDVVRRDRRSLLTILLSALSVAAAFLLPALSYLIIALLAAGWIPAGCQREEKTRGHGKETACDTKKAL